MTAIPTARPVSTPAGAARLALVGALALLAVGCATVIGWSSVRSPPASGADALRLAFDLVPLVAALITAGFMVRAPQLTWFSGYLAVTLVLYVVGATRVDDLAAGMLSGAPWFVPAFTVASCFGFLPAAYLFPNGRFVPSWSRWLLLGWAAAGALALAFPWNDFPPGALAALSVLAVGLLGSLIGAQFYRYRRISTQLERQQTKWLLLALGVQAAWLMVVIGFPPNTIGNLPGPEGVVLDTVISAFGALVMTALAVAIGFAMLRYRLFDVDLVIGRALVYGAVTVFVLASYAVLVGAVGLLWPAGTPIALPVAATFVVATGAAPLRRIVQRRANRWLYGQRDEPAVVLGRLGEALSATSDLDGTLARIATTVQEALRFPRVSAVALDRGQLAGEFIAGDVAVVLGSATVGIVFEGRTVGRLDVSPRTGERVTPRDLALLERLARPAGVAIHAALVTVQLRRSRAELIEAREQERQRLHRDLHDGLGPTLASLHQRIDLAERAIAANSGRALVLLGGAKAGIDGALGELRALVDSLRPAALDQFGLAGAVIEAWSSDERVLVTVPDALPPLPAAIESAAYRISMEAVSNALRHSGGRHCSVTFTGAEEVLTIQVADDGRGLAATVRTGGGFRTMRERATELGGTLVIADSGPGTCVTARLPLAEVAG
jgi:signal transduction histidine kinase